MAGGKRNRKFSKIPRPGMANAGHQFAMSSRGCDRLPWAPHRETCTQLALEVLKRSQSRFLQVFNISSARQKVPKKHTEGLEMKI